MFGGKLFLQVLKVLLLEPPSGIVLEWKQNLEEVHYNCSLNPTVVIDPVQCWRHPLPALQAPQAPTEPESANPVKRCSANTVPRFQVTFILIS
ncbi:hypothetical protein GCM10007937_01340 [Mesorhizobium albiziae]|nr:hypothetical protein GCM10007937_01340 [Mesorhizobium albiziae]